MFCSCGEYETLEIQRTLDKRVDSIFYADKDSLKNLNDSLCEIRYTDLYKLAIDSLKEVHLNKIRALNKQ